jgi:hypothetical protein
MDVSLTTHPLAPSSFLTVSSFGCHVPTRPHRTARLSPRFVPPMMSCAPYCSRLPFWLATGLRAFTLPPTPSTFRPPRPSQPPPPTSLFLAPLPPTPTYGSSGALATLTPLPLLPTSSSLSVYPSWVLLRAQGVPVSRSQHEPHVGLPARCLR